MVVARDFWEFCGRKFDKRVLRDSERVSKAPNWRAFLAFWKNILQIVDCLAGQTGFEPENASFYRIEIVIECLKLAPADFGVEAEKIGRRHSYFLPCAVLVNLIPTNRE